MFGKLQLFVNIYFITCHNILRLPTVRKARFELRHDGKVQSNAHYKEIQIKTIDVCVDRCVADTQCKSVNFLEKDSETLDLCQLVAYDVTDNNNYVDRPGWEHYDTGRTKITRLRVKYNNYCYVPQDQDCEFGWTYLITVAPSDPRCNYLSAYFEFDRHLGHIYHYCTGKFVAPNPYGNSAYVKIMDSDDARPIYGYNYNKWRRWKTHHDGSLYFSQYCMRPSSTGSSYVYIYTDCFHYLMPVVFMDLDEGPVKTSYYLNHVYNSYDSGLLSSMQSYISNNSPNIVHYSYGFEYTRTTQYDHFTLRMQAIYQAPFTGYHKFWFIGDDFAFLFIGNDETEASKQQVATLKYATSSYYTAHSGTKYLEKDKRYYMEVLLHEMDGGDYVVLSVSGDLYDISLPVSLDFLERYNG